MVGYENAIKVHCVGRLLMRNVKVKKTSNGWQRPEGWHRGRSTSKDRRDSSWHTVNFIWGDYRRQMWSEWIDGDSKVVIDLVSWPEQHRDYCCCCCCCCFGLYNNNNNYYYYYYYYTICFICLRLLESDIFQLMCYVHTWSVCTNFYQIWKREYMRTF